MKVCQKQLHSPYRSPYASNKGEHFFSQILAGIFGLIILSDIMRCYIWGILGWKDEAVGSFAELLFSGMTGRTRDTRE